MFAQINITTNSGGLETVLALFFFGLWIVLIAMFIQMAINVGKIRRMMEDDRRPRQGPRP